MPSTQNIGLRAAQPTINLGGEDRADLAGGLLNLLIVETASGLYRCEALFGNWGANRGGTGFLFFDRRALDFGKALKIKLGRDVIFDGKITAMEANFPVTQPPELCVLAEDRFQDLRMTRRTRTFENLTDSSVVQQIANEHGLQPDVSLNSPTHRVLAQVNQSDLAFLRERTRANDAEMWVEGDKLRAKARAQRDGGTLQLSYRGALREFSVMADLARQATSVTASGWDVAGKSALKHETGESVISGELNGGESGAKILQSAFGSRKEALAHTVPLTAQEAQAFAEAYFRMNARRFLTGRGVAEPDARLRVGSFVELSGLGPLFSGKYYLSEVRHRFDRKNGLRTEFIGEKPGLGRP
jgi:uncharacterized protein